MKNKIRTTLAFLIAIALVACGPAVLSRTGTPTATVDDAMMMTAQMGLTLAMMLTQTAQSCLSCTSESVSMTAVMATAFASTPSNTPPPNATVFPSAGDLGWGTVYGRILDGESFQPIRGATVRCEQFSSTSPYQCNGVTTTKEDGSYSFTNVFFHDTDQFTLIVEAPGYQTLRFKEQTVTRAELRTDLGLLRNPGDTPPPTPTLVVQIVCTPPPCNGGTLVCESINACPGGCGTVCKIPTPFLSCTPPACTGGQLVCGAGNGCPGGCGTVCQMPTP